MELFNNMKDLLIELIKKIELQSVLVLFFTLLFGCFLLYQDNSFTTPAGVLGSISIAIGLLYTFGSFFSNQIRESYKDVITHYESIIKTHKTSAKDVQKFYQQSTLSSGIDSKKVDKGTYLSSNTLSDSD